MSRSDRESNSVAYSDDPFNWPSAVSCQQPARAWEALQLGNCGPPIETEAGWLVLTHGVGPMRTYRIGAILLDLEEPTRIIGQLRQPLLSPAADEQDGYVPNVVYSCGALVHAETLVIRTELPTRPSAWRPCRYPTCLPSSPADKRRSPSSSEPVYPLLVQLLPW